MTIISETGRAVISPLQSLWEGLIELVPGLAGAVIVAIVGYFLGMLLGFIVHKVLDKAGLDKALKQVDIKKYLGDRSLSSICGTLLKWYIFVIFLTSAVDLIKLKPLADLLQKLVLWLPQLLAGIVVMVIGFIAAEFIYDKIINAKKMKGVETIATVVRIIIIVFVAVIALDMIGIRINFAREVLLIILASVGLGFAIALGIGFGDALKKNANSMLNALKK